MTRLHLLGTLFVFFFSLGSPKWAQAQEIESRKSHFFYEGQRLQPRNMLEIMKDHPKAYEEMRAAKSNYDVAQVLGGIGGFMIGWPVGTAIAGGDPNWLLAGIGAGVIIGSIPMLTAYSKRSRAAVDMYNEGIRGHSMHPVQIQFGGTSAGLGLMVTF
ncbi:hypothetical protein [Pleomorphovibrio marinus]|uniref:hypothetical protein n=1 Tax=Pleomorphovibrio marinus TaxID=2164132 RepID=UPI000E0A0728|nr:hypothetical protein [Pleomorphovibrio marinus]